MLSHATSVMGRGWGFGLHEAMDQVGAFLGPILVSGILLWRTEAATQLTAYRTAFALLLIPALLALGCLGFARLQFPRPEELESKSPVVAAQGFSWRYWSYLAAVGLVAAGFVDFPLIAFHLRRIALVPQPLIPGLYALAMAVDAVAALVFGRLYDQQGLPVLALAFGASAISAPLLFLGGLPLVVAGMIVWGIGMGAQESIARAAIADLIPAGRRASAYGLFHTAFGLSWFLGSGLMGLIYDRSLIAVATLSVALQVAAIPVLLLTTHRSR
jgi:predicted MFS family arabinose efflux permease